MRPGADCCCDGEEWDEVPESQKLVLYPAPYVRTAKCLTVITFLVSWIAVVFVAVGYSYLSSTAQFLLREMKSSILNWIRDTMLDVQKEVVLEDGSYIPPLTEATFTPVYEVYDWLNDWHQYMTETYDEYDANVQLGFILVASVPSGLFLVTIFVAYCNVRRVVPKACACLFFFLGAVCGIIGVLLLSIGVLGTAVCGEITLQDRKLPGILQWSIVPQCEEQLFLKSLQNDLRNMEAEKARDACTTFDEVCGPGEVYNYTKSDELFKCDFLSPENGVDPAIDTKCSTLVDSIAIIESGVMKTGNPICVNCNDIYDCATRCTDPYVKNMSYNTVQSIQMGKNASRVLTKLLPVLDCDGLLTRLFLPLRRCTDFTFGAFCVGCGACWAVILFMWEIILMLRGSKVFFDRDDAEAEIEEDAHNYNNPTNRKRHIDDYDDDYDDDEDYESSLDYDGGTSSSGRIRPPPPPPPPRQKDRSKDYSPKSNNGDDFERSNSFIIPPPPPPPMNSNKVKIPSSPPPTKPPPVRTNNFFNELES